MVRHHGPTWHNDDAQLAGPLERQIRRWSYLAIMRQRDINRQDICRVLGVRRQAADQWLDTMTEGAQEKLDEAITKITDERGGVQACIVGALREPVVSRGGIKPKGQGRQPQRDALSGISHAHTGKGLTQKHEGTPFKPHPNSLAQGFKGERKREYERWLSKIKGDAA